MHEELAAEAYEHNVSINQIVFEAITARRTLRGRPAMQRALGRLDATGRVDRELTAQVVEGALVADARARLEETRLTEEQRAVLDAVRELGQCNAQMVSERLQGRDQVDIASALFVLSLHGLLVRLPGEQYRLNAMAARASPRVQ